MGGKMKFGEMKYDVPFEKIKNHHWDFNPLQEFMIELEGKRLYKSHPEYSYLQEDPWLKTDRDFYESIVFAYMMDFIKQNDPQYLEYYIKVYGEEDPNDKRHKATNQTYLNRYVNYLREQADPGCLERERQKEEKELQESIAFHAAIAKMDEEQHPHVPCPYCKSTNTEKISTVSRAVSVSLVGAASSKLGKQWHCNNCKSDF